MAALKKAQSASYWNGRHWKRRCRKLNLFLIFIAFTSTCFCIYISYVISPGTFHNRLLGERIVTKPVIMMYRSEPEAIKLEPVSDSTEEMKCVLPQLEPFHPSITEFLSPMPDVNCEAKYPKLFRTNFESKLIQIQKLDNAACSYRTIQRKPGTDSVVRLSKISYSIEEGNFTIPSSHEFILLSCTYTILENKTIGNNTISTLTKRNYTDMFAFIPLKPEVESRVEMLEANNNLPTDRLSVVMLGLDAQSHMNFQRQMPLSSDYLLRNLSAHVLNGYTKVGDNTFPNLVPILTGLSVDELKDSCWGSRRTHFDDCPFIWKDFEAKGYRTAFAEDSVWMGMFNYEKRGFLRQPTDYYSNHFAHQMAKRIGHEPSGNSKLCYGPRLAFEVLLDYMVKAAVTFQGKPYFQFIWANSLFHDYLNYPKLGDEMLSQTLQFFSANGFLNNTVLILLSDHGIRWGSIRTTYQGRIEERMPLAYFVLPAWLREKYPTAIRNLELNSNRLSTPYDLHETLSDLLDLNTLGSNLRSSRGQTLFSRIPKTRTCDESGIEEHWCVCNSMEPLSLHDPIVKNGTAFILETLNQLISNYSDCAKLKLAKIINAFRKSVVDKNVMRPIQITVVTWPGEAIFESTLNYFESENDTRWEVTGEISRLNLYGNQSKCISDYSVQKFCYCNVEKSKIRRRVIGKAVLLH